MKHQRLIKVMVAIMLAAPVTYMSLNDTSAVNFKGKEDTYYKICSSSRLSTAKQKTCKKFNEYLKKQSQEIKNDISDTKSTISNTKESLETLMNKVEQFDKEIKSTEKRISFIQTTIKNTKEKLAKKEEKLKDRIYAMQVETNSGTYLNYLFAADSFTDFFSRIASLNDVTAYENELMDDIKEEKKQLLTQESDLKDEKATLTEQKEENTKLVATYKQKLKEEEATLRKSYGDLSVKESNIETIAKNLAALKKATDQSRVTGVTKASGKTTKTVKKKVKKKVEKQVTEEVPDENDSSKTKTVTKTVEVEEEVEEEVQEKDGSAELGLKIANKALSRQGAPYVYGACHSMSQVKNPSQWRFDCSGLVSWAHYQAGVNIGAQYTGSLISYGKKVSRSQLQAGDIILFNHGGYGGVSHVGIYIGGNKMVHAPVPGKPVQVANLGISYWQKSWITCRRCY